MVVVNRFVGLRRKDASLESALDVFGLMPLCSTLRLALPEVF